jgi:hypothetical protein
VYVLKSAALPVCLRRKMNKQANSLNSQKGLPIMQQNKVTVYYDGACPKCVRDRQNYEKLSGKQVRRVEGIF